MYGTKTIIVEESTHVKFDGKLDPKKSKLDENFVDIEITCSDSKDKDPDSKNSRHAQPEESNTPTPLRKYKYQIPLPKKLISADKIELVKTRYLFK